MDEEHQAGTKGLKYARSQGVAVVVMEPLLGGNLTSPPERIAALWATAGRKRSPVEWALAWAWSKPEVNVVLSGMSAMEHVEENLRLADSAQELSAADLELVGRVRDRYREIRPVPCTQCEYCMPCPNGVAIPRVFRIYNDGVAYNNPARAKRMHAQMEAGSGAAACIECRECEPKCPQNIEISSWMPRIAGELKA
jgi:predicted aldo/keto reductase-like oxidoreductase